MSEIYRHRPACEIWTDRRSSRPPHRQRVLVVDDYVDGADAVCAYLCAVDIDARVAYGGCDALRIAAAWRPHSIVLDIAMPDLSGLSVATTLRAMSGLGQTVLIAYTAQAERDYERIRASGFDGICCKPADPPHPVRLLEQLSLQTRH
ncbi:response regulator [Paraburkholderia sediminicola]|uniref:response regulator n=1 Tax=Paraburkholderia sediminicola TaxID=458836 RepID=UPI0038BAA675